MRRSFGQFQQDSANNPILVVNELPSEHLAAGQYLQRLVDAEAYDAFFNDFPTQFPSLIGTGFGYHCIAFAHLYAGNADDALAAINQALDVRSRDGDPRIWGSHQLKGRILDLLFDDYPEAMHQFRMALELKPEDPHTQIGMLCAASKHSDEGACIEAIDALNRRRSPWIEDDWIVDRFRNDIELRFARSLPEWKTKIAPQLDH